MPASFGTHIQHPTSTNLKQYNADQPDTSWTTTICQRHNHAPTPTLQQRRQHFKIIMLYRITHQLASIPTATYITPSTRNTQHYILPYARTQHVFKTSFFPSTIKIWNNLQPVITNSTSIHNLDKQCNPHQHSVGVGLHAQLGLSGHLTLIASYPTHSNPHQHPVGVVLHAQLGLRWRLTLTSIISYTLCTAK